MDRNCCSCSGSRPVICKKCGKRINSTQRCKKDLKGPAVRCKCGKVAPPHNGQCRNDGHAVATACKCCKCITNCRKPIAEDNNVCNKCRKARAAAECNCQCCIAKVPAECDCNKRCATKVSSECDCTNCCATNTAAECDCNKCCAAKVAPVCDCNTCCAAKVAPECDCNNCCTTKTAAECDCNNCRNGKAESESNECDAEMEIDWPRNYCCRACSTKRKALVNPFSPRSPSLCTSGNSLNQNRHSKNVANKQAKQAAKILFRKVVEALNHVNNGCGATVEEIACYLCGHYKLPLTYRELKQFIDLGLRRAVSLNLVKKDGDKYCLH